MAFFNHKNVLPNCTVYQVGQVAPIADVLSVDTDAAQIKVVPRPFKIEGGEVATEIKQFVSIAPIYGGGFVPCMFLCFA